MTMDKEHEKQIARFQGYPYDPEESARLRAWAKFKKSHHDRLIASRPDLSLVRKGKPPEE